MGDTNARTAMQEDHIQNDSDKFIPETIPYMIDVSLPERHSQDKSLNERGTVLMDMCISSGLRILNGRKPGDSLGYFTCHKYNGSSTVDYGIVSECLFRNIMYFHVHKAMRDLSDHCQISLSIQNLNFTRQVPHNLGSSMCYVWSNF